MTKQQVRDFTEEHGRAPTKNDLVYDVILRGPWYRMLEKAATEKEQNSGGT